MTAASRLTPAEVVAAQAILDEWTAEVRACIPGGTVLVLPSTPGPAPCRDRALSPTLRRELLGLTAIASAAGLPALSVPIGTRSGRPVGLCLVGPLGSDEHLLEFALTLTG